MSKTDNNALMPLLMLMLFNDNEPEYEIKSETKHRGRSLESLSEIAAFLPNPPKREVYRLFGIQDMLKKLKSNEYETLSNDEDDKERNKRLMEFLIDKNPRLKGMKSMMDNMENIKKTISLMSNLQGGEKKENVHTKEYSNEKEDIPEEDPYEEFYDKETSSVKGLLNRKQRNSLSKLLNSIR